MDCQGRILCDPKVMLGKPVVKGTRLTVEHLLEQMGNGWTEADLLEAYPGLVREDLRACYAFAAKALKVSRH